MSVGGGGALAFGEVGLRGFFFFLSSSSGWLAHMSLVSPIGL
jgi:hypothetical protein